MNNAEPPTAGGSQSEWGGRDRITVPTDVEDEDRAPCYPISLQTHGKNLANVPFLKSEISPLLFANLEN